MSTTDVISSRVIFAAGGKGLDPMQPLSNETMIREAPGGVGLVLTSHRVRLDIKKWGEIDTTSIMLDELASCGIKGSSRPALLVAAPLLALVGLASGADGFRVLGVVLAVVLVVVYFLTRHRELALTSAGESIRVPLRQRMSVEDAKSFIDTVEHTKDRLTVWRHSTPPMQLPPPPAPSGH